MRMTALLPSRTRSVRDQARWLIAAGALALVPWAAILWNTLPSTAHVRNWSSAWVGLDLFLAAGCGLTTGLLRRNDSRARLVASAVAGAAVIDLWFDLVTADPGAPLAQAMLCAIAETALIAACMHVALAPDDAVAPPSRRIAFQP
ncbi:hypothetical protein F3087_30735 [Nocardia colli]|uniref:Uncharacterized protein n=1 Tax=Nocardia colli TaxID=2545717 RepID=A0A5N0EAJ8_9NOCA|nr:hypothetical protein [Nocardia colli]KAA8885204.1 hypothetical protein F3087_30735 [Nocardia colli]